VLEPSVQEVGVRRGSGSGQEVERRETVHLEASIEVLLDRLKGTRDRELLEVVLYQDIRPIQDPRGFVEPPRVGMVGWYSSVQAQGFLVLVVLGFPISVPE